MGIKHKQTNGETSFVAGIRAAEIAGEEFGKVHSHKKERCPYRRKEHRQAWERGFDKTRAKQAREVLDGLPGLKEAFLGISGYNGGINRDRPEERMLNETAVWLVAQMVPNRREIDDWLAALHSEDMLTVCDGEDTDRAELLESAPPLTDELLIRFFREVC